MTFLLLLAVFGFVVAVLVAPGVDDVLRRRRRARAELLRCGGVVRPTSAPRFDGGPRRCDPSPRRRLTDYEWRALADGSEQT